MEEDGIETNFPQKFRTRETADLFLVLILRLLKDVGQASVVKCLRYERLNQNERNVYQRLAQLGC
jgi:hypothetical protein